MLSNPKYQTEGKTRGKARQAEVAEVHGQTQFLQK